MKTCFDVFRLLLIMFPAICFSGEIVYQDYLGESDLLSTQDREAKAWVSTEFDWNYFFKSNSLALAMKIKYEKDGTNLVFRPIVARYDFNGVHEPVDKSIRRADTCYRSVFPSGFCMVDLDSFLFSYDQRPSPKTVFMCISDSTQSVVDITRDLNGMCLHGSMSTSERAVFPNGDGFAFQCIGNSNGWNLLLWDKGIGTLRPVLSRLRGYACLSGGRVMMDELDTADLRTTHKCHSMPTTLHDRQIASNLWESESRECWKLKGHCYHVLPCCDASIAPNVYADWLVPLSNKVISLGKDGSGINNWSIDLHEMAKGSSDNELGHEFVEAQGVLYDFHSWELFRIRKSDLGWQVLDLREFFKEDIDLSEASVPLSILHRGVDSCYYALLFELKKRPGDCKPKYRIRIVEVSRRGEKVFLWKFQDFNVVKKLNTFGLRSPGAVHKFHDGSWIFLSSTGTFSNDAVFVQRMTGSREEINPEFHFVK